MSDLGIPMFSAAWWLLVGEFFEIATAVLGAACLGIAPESWRVSVPLALLFFGLAALAKSRGEALDAENRRRSQLDAAPAWKD